MSITKLETESVSPIYDDNTLGRFTDTVLTIRHGHCPEEPAPLKKWKEDMLNATKHVQEYFRTEMVKIARKQFTPGTPVKWARYGSYYWGEVASDLREVIVLPISGDIAVRVQPYNPNGSLSPVVVTMPAENLTKLTTEEIQD